mmetsp:Transcript_32645/g.78457  ORF Transcript_32645/g.78457 Transcript_32645/m.78457 type:complete len:205 (-) Transcript_32645:285-899(-)
MRTTTNGHSTNPSHITQDGFHIFATKRRQPSHPLPTCPDHVNLSHPIRPQAGAKRFPNRFKLRRMNTDSVHVLLPTPPQATRTTLTTRVTTLGKRKSPDRHQLLCTLIPLGRTKPITRPRQRQRNGQRILRHTSHDFNPLGIVTGRQCPRLHHRHANCRQRIIKFLDESTDSRPRHGPTSIRQGTPFTLTARYGTSGSHPPTHH